MRKVLRLILIGFIITVFSCSNNSNKETINANNSLVSYLVDTVLKDAPNYSLCGNFSNLPDSIMEASLKYLPDSILGKDDLVFMMDQYEKSKNEELIHFIDTSNYRIVEKLELYSNFKFYKYHYVTSIPMVNKNKNLCLLYLTVFVDKEGSSDLFLVFEKDETDNWINTVNILNEIEIPFAKYHYHDYSLIKKEMFE
ncbi:MAG: hypothetical protein GQ564_12920 [Bacteroidales bacterium]|nr:hypothetical protein [Bacteroidales bacterium]